ncbi:MAG: DNA repair protein RecO [Bacteroidia bacterium]
MILKTEAICLKSTRYGESSVISKMFTMEHGLSSFIIQGINRKSSQIRPSHIAPGNIVELVVYQKVNSTIQRVKDIKVINGHYEIHTSMVKNAVLQFILEIIVKTNEDDFKEPMVFNFLKHTIIELEDLQHNIGNVPLFFLCSYLKFSGWFPNLEMCKEDSVFSINEGRFITKSNDEFSLYLSINQSRELFKILSLIQDCKETKKIEINFKKDLFNALLKYYEIHILKGKRIKSPSVLAEIFS